MAFGKLYTSTDSPHTTAIVAVAKENKLDLDIQEIDSRNTPATYLKLNKLGKVPTFQGADGYILTESIAIAIYVTSQNERTTLLGKTKQDYASILRWMSFTSQEINVPLGNWIRPLLNEAPYNKKNVEDSQISTLQALSVFEEHLLENTYLVGERLTLADLFSVGLISRGFHYVLDKAWREQHPNTSRWFETVYHQPIYSEAAPKFEVIAEAIKYQPPKKEPAPKKEQAPKEPRAKAKEVEDDDEEDEAPAAPKPKHPLEALDRATFVLDDWKRKYSNEDIRAVALPWFWDNAKFDEYSLWRVNYKYNDELTLIFMTSNLVGGFFNRLEASRKYLFGALGVYGQSSDSIVTGAFIVRGNEAVPAFDVAPDFESYEFVKLDPKDEKDRAFIEDIWAQDKPVEVEGKKYEYADGKVFK